MVNSEDFLENSVRIQENILDNQVISLNTREERLNCNTTGCEVTETLIGHLPEEVLQKVDFTEGMLAISFQCLMISYQLN